MDQLQIINFNIMTTLIENIKTYLILSIFAIYWGITLFFVVLPEDSAPILLNYHSAIRFNDYFYQNWGFFAPPPNYNQRLYYSFENINNPSVVKTVEIFEKLSADSKNKYPFNDNELLLDYVIHNTAEAISTKLRNDYQNYQYDLCDNEDKEDCYQNFMKSLDNNFFDNQAGNTLVNYGKLIAEKLKLGDKYKLKITYATMPINKFSKRYDKDNNRELSIVFQTHYYNLTTNKWAN